MLMEMLLVMPLYMLVFGGIYYLGESILMDNRILQGGRAFGYVALHTLGANNSVDSSFTQAMNEFQDSDGWIRRLPNDSNGNKQGELNWAAYFMNDNSVATKTAWGGILYSYTTLENIPLPAGIDGMMRMGDGLYTPDKASEKTPGMSFGTRQIDEYALRHWLVARFAELPASRPPMGTIVSSSDPKYKYYYGAQHYINQSSGLLVENWILGPKMSDSNASSDTAADYYTRLYDTMFSSH